MSDLPETAGNGQGSHTIVAPVPGHIEPPKSKKWEPADAVEAALAGALEEASKAGKWDVVAQLGQELAARRSARASNIVPIRRKSTP